jgi:hypothetical protein
MDLRSSGGGGACRNGFQNRRNRVAVPLGGRAVTFAGRVLELLGNVAESSAWDSPPVSPPAADPPSAPLRFAFDPPGPPDRKYPTQRRLAPSHLACWLGHFEFAVAAARRAVSVDPQNVRIRGVRAKILIYARCYSQPQRVLQDARTLAPNSHEIEARMSENFIASGRFEQARKACESRSTPLDDDDRHSCVARVATPALDQ